MRRHGRHRMTHVQVIVLGFLLMVVSGTILLMLPFASKDGRSAGLLTALFTASSASCVTGLIRRSTAEWSFFGQLVLLILIQIGGLGFMTIAAMFFHLLNKRMGLWQRETMVESINLSKVKGITELAREIIACTAVIELAGAALLSIRFVPLLGERAVVRAVPRGVGFLQRRFRPYGRFAGRRLAHVFRQRLACMPDGHNAHSAGRPRLYRMG